jgi:hypothetical protein
MQLQGLEFEMLVLSKRWEHGQHRENILMYLLKKDYFNDILRKKI